MTVYTPSLLNAGVEQMELGTVRADWPVAAGPLKGTQATVNWLFGRGQPLVIDGARDWSGSGAQSRTLNYRYQVDNAHTVIAVYITMSAVLAPGNNLAVEVAGTFTFQVTGTPQTFVYAIPILAAGEIAHGVQFDWTGTAFSRLFIHNLYIIEAPQHVLPQGGVEPVEAREAIYDGSANKLSISGLEAGVENLRSNYFRRGTMYSWAAGGTDGVNTTSTSYVDLHPHGIRPAMQNRLMYFGETLRSVKANVYARVSGGTGNVRLTMGNGDTLTFNVTSTSNTWHTTAAIDVETDDPSRWDTDGGIRGGSRDELTIEYRAGAGETLYLLGVSVWDGPGA